MVMLLCILAPFTLLLYPSRLQKADNTVPPELRRSIRPAAKARRLDNCPTRERQRVRCADVQAACDFGGAQCWPTMWKYEVQYLFPIELTSAPSHIGCYASR